MKSEPACLTLLVTKAQDDGGAGDEGGVRCAQSHVGVGRASWDKMDGAAPRKEEISATEV